jgi:hypothetical protein
MRRCAASWLASVFSVAPSVGGRGPQSVLRFERLDHRDVGHRRDAEL